MKIKFQVMKDLPKPIMLDYWNSVKEAGLLGLRVANIRNPQMIDVLKAIDSNPSWYMALDTDNEDGLPLAVCDFHIQTICGQSAMIHFGANPRLDMDYRVKAINLLSNELITGWMGYNNKPFITSLHAYIPDQNKAMLTFAKKVGFEPLCWVPNSAYYLGEPSHAIYVVKMKPSFLDKTRPSHGLAS